MAWTQWPERRDDEQLAHEVSPLPWMVPLLPFYLFECFHWPLFGDKSHFVQITILSLSFLDKCFIFELSFIIFKVEYWGTWIAQLVKCPTSGHGLMIHEFELTLWAQSPPLILSLPFSLQFPHSCSLSLSKINFKKVRV